MEDIIYNTSSCVLILFCFLEHHVYTDALADSSASMMLLGGTYHPTESCSTMKECVEDLLSHSSVWVRGSRHDWAQKVRSLPSVSEHWLNWYAISPDRTLKSLNLRWDSQPEGEEGESDAYDASPARDPGDGKKEVFSCVMSRVCIGGVIGIESTTIAGISTCPVSAGRTTSSLRKRHTILCW